MSVCLYCGKEFDVTKRRKVFCSQKCNALYQLSKMPPKKCKYLLKEKKKTCKNCGEVYYRFPSQKSSFCSRECQIAWFRKHPIKYWLGKKRPEIKEFFTMKGRKHSDETKEKMRKIHKGKKISTKQRMQISKTLMGHPANRGSGIGKSGYREDENYYRSTWEANVARTLRYEGLDFFYEPLRVKFKGFTYTPDFYIPELDWFLEVKGYMTSKAKRKIEKFREWCNERDIAFTVIQKPKYEQLSQQYSDVIPSWELNK